MENNEIGSWTFTYLSADGNQHSITVTAKTLQSAVDWFTDTFGSSTSFIVSL